ncbi:MAG: sodium/solute symporter [Planctomycetes bacterium]|nr:sodium/solute symporter [Planctomycetota bacterium]
MSSALAWQDHAVIAAYLLGMIALGVHLSRRQKSDEEYFLAGRNMPWFAVGMSVIASLLSSLTYLSEPAEVWNSGVTNIFGKMLAIPFEMVIVWLFCIPFMMRFRFTSAYEYLEHRFGPGTRLLGAGLFVAMIVLWMGFVVYVSALALSTVSGVPIGVVIGTVGVVATIYTMLGGLRAVIWTDVVQVVLLVGGGVFTIAYVAVVTDTWIPQWYDAAVARLTATKPGHHLPLFSFDPTVRVTVVTVAMSMCVWHVCAHTANQMTVQRYFSTKDIAAARRSFVTGSLLGVGLNLMLMTVGLAMLYFYVGQDTAELPLDPETGKVRYDLIFPSFAVHRLPAGLGGGILAALLAAAMSSIDSGVNSIATVVSVEWKRHQQRRGRENAESVGKSHVAGARWITLVAGLFITVAAFCLKFLPPGWGIIDAMPRTFNAITAPLGGLFLMGMFMPFVRGRAAVAGTSCGILTSILIGYYGQIGWVLHKLGVIADLTPTLSPNWVMPCAMTVTIASAALFSLFDRSGAKDLAALTWYTRREKSPLTQPD